MSTSDASVTTSATGPVLTGRVKWFNNKSGYGFLMVIGGDKEGSEVFVHHSSINVNEQQYRYLVQGEYVEFRLKKMESGPHEYQASEVCGVKGGKLICETRYEARKSNSSSRKEKPSNSATDGSSTPARDRPLKTRGRGTSRVQSQGEQRQPRNQKQVSAPSHSNDKGGEWMLVRVKRSDIQPVSTNSSTSVPVPARGTSNPRGRGRGSVRAPRQSKPQSNESSH